MSTWLKHVSVCLLGLTLTLLLAGSASATLSAVDITSPAAGVPLTFTGPNQGTVQVTPALSDSFDCTTSAVTHLVGGSTGGIRVISGPATGTDTVAFDIVFVQKVSESVSKEFGTFTYHVHFNIVLTPTQVDASSTI